MPVTMDGTPEGDNIRRRLNADKRVKEITKLDELGTFFWSDLRDDARLSRTAKYLYAIMGSYGPTAFATISTYAEAIGCTPVTVRTAQKELEDAGWVVLVREGKGGGGKTGEARLWWLNDVANQHVYDDDTKRAIEQLRAKVAPGARVAPRGKGSPPGLVKGSPEGGGYLNIYQ